MLAALRALVEQQSVEEDYSKFKYVLNRRFSLLSVSYVMVKITGVNGVHSQALTRSS